MLIFKIYFVGLCVKAVTEPDSAESTEITERPGPNLRKIANKYDLLLPVSSGTGSILQSVFIFKYYTHNTIYYRQDMGNGPCLRTSGHF